MVGVVLADIGPGGGPSGEPKLELWGLLALVVGAAAAVLVRRLTRRRVAASSSS